MYIYIYMYIYICVCVCGVCVGVCVCVCACVCGVCGNDIDFRPMHFSFCGNLKKKLFLKECLRMFQHSSHSSFNLTSYNIYVQSLLLVKF